MTVYDALENLSALAQKGYGNMELVNVDLIFGYSTPVAIYQDISTANPKTDSGYLRTVGEGQVFVPVQFEY